MRASVFVDAGQIYGIPLAQPCDPTIVTAEVCGAFRAAENEAEKFRFSYGVGLAWNSPMGPLKFSYGIPFKVRTGDRIQKFQFQVGSVF